MAGDKKTKSSKGEVAVYKFYTIHENKVSRAKRDCPRCGKGVFMAQHKDRFSCGKCGFTEFSQKETKKGNKK
jgi:small subunit ribosomal protein S27Ae